MELGNCVTCLSLLMSRLLASWSLGRHTETAEWWRAGVSELMIRSAASSGHWLRCTEITSTLFSQGNEISYLMLLVSKLHSDSFMLHRLLDHSDSYTKLAMAAGQKQLP